MRAQPDEYYHRIREALEVFWRAALTDSREGMEAAIDQLAAAVKDRPASWVRKP